MAWVVRDDWKFDDKTRPFVRWVDRNRNLTKLPEKAQIYKDYEEALAVATAGNAWTGLFCLRPVWRLDDQEDHIPGH